MSADTAEGNRFTFRFEAMSATRVHVLLAGGPHGCKTHLKGHGHAELAPSDPKKIWIVSMGVAHTNGRRAAIATRQEVLADAKVALAAWLKHQSTPSLLRAAGKEARRREVALAESALKEARVGLVNARKRLAKATREVAGG